MPDCVAFVRRANSDGNCYLSQNGYALKNSSGHRAYIRSSAPCGTPNCSPFSSPFHQLKAEREGGIPADCPYSVSEGPRQYVGTWLERRRVWSADCEQACEDNATCVAFTAGSKKCLLLGAPLNYIRSASTRTLYVKPDFLNHTCPLAPDGRLAWSFCIRKGP